MDTFLALLVVLLAAVASVAAGAYRRLTGHLDDHDELTRRQLLELLVDDRIVRERLASLCRGEAKNYLQQRAEQRGEVFHP